MEPIDPTLRSWVPDARTSGFPLQHLPYGAFSPPGGRPRLGVRIGGQVLDVRAAAEDGLLDGIPAGAVRAGNLDGLLQADRPVWSALRARLVELLAADATPRPELLHDLEDVDLHLPFTVADYVDFYSSLHHATNVGRLFRPDGDPLLPNWRHLPVAYHGRAGTVVASGTTVTRPVGQRAPAEAGGRPGFGPSDRLDFELELGFVTGMPEPRTRITTADAAEVVFGLLLVNDWSARDIQAWEYQPLGPFLGKSFATSVAAWVTPLDAVAHVRVSPPPQDPPPLPYLATDGPWGLDLELTAEVAPGGSDEATPITATNSRHLYWTIPQQLAHATVNGATARSGDLYATGTISGPDPGSEGCLLEQTDNGAVPLRLEGAARTWLEDGDTVILRGRCAGRDGHPPITLGPVSGDIRPAPQERP